MAARDITRVLHSRTGGNIVIAASVAAIVVAWYAGAPMYPGESIVCGWSGLLLGLVFTAMTAVVLQLVNKRFNMVRSDTALTPVLFMTMIVSLPPLGYSFGDGNVLALAMTAGAMMLFSTYADPAMRRRVFLLFCIVSALGMTCVVYFYYLPVLLVGCAQMRLLSLRTVLAALLGIITPPWIVIGGGLVSPDDIDMPGLSVPSMQVDSPVTVTILAVAAFTIIMGVAFTCANLIKVYSYNSRTRAMNGYYSLLFLATVLLTLIDFNNLSLYLPLLMAMVGYQACHFWAIRSASPRSWIGIVLFMAVYWGIYIWYTWFIKDLAL